MIKTFNIIFLDGNKAISLKIFVWIRFQICNFTAAHDENYLVHKTCCSKKESSKLKFKGYIFPENISSTSGAIKNYAST